MAVNAERPQRNIGMDLVRATESAAIVAARHLDRGALDQANIASIEAMRLVLNTLDVDGHVAVGEDMGVLGRGAHIGTGHGLQADLAVDAIEGTPERTLHRPDALSIAAVADRGSMWHAGPIQYVRTLAVGPAVRDRIDLTHDVRTNLNRISVALKCSIRQLNVLVLDRPRHAGLIKEINACGARVQLHYGGFIAGTILAAMPNSNIDVMISTGLAQDAVLAAAAVKALGGAMEIRPDPQSPEEAEAIKAQLGNRGEVILDQDDLIRSDDVYFAATSITGGALMHGVKFGRDGTQVESLVIRAKTGTIRHIRATLQPEKLGRISQIDYDGEGG
jgi:fructose-1,6-bisphosphatase II